MLLDYDDMLWLKREIQYGEDQKLCTFLWGVVRFDTMVLKWKFYLQKEFVWQNLGISFPFLDKFQQGKSWKLIEHRW